MENSWMLLAFFWYSIMESVGCGRKLFGISLFVLSKNCGMQKKYDR